MHELISCRAYRDLKDYIADILNGDVEEYDPEAIANHILNLYEGGEIQAGEYDDLMRYLQDM